MNRFAINSTLGLLFLSLISMADKPPIKFGNVSMDELKMSVYEPDTSAPAVVLCDYGYFNSNQFQFTHIIRIKILKKEGYSWANRSFPGYNKSFVKGITFNLENGEIVESKLKNESIFREKINERSDRLRITMPNVKVGSVIDIEYAYSWIPAEWWFQQEIPVKWSELKLEDNPYVSFRKNFFGFEPLSVSEPGHWIAKNMPAFKVEPYISSPENYLTKFEFDILDIHVGMVYEAFTTSWEELSDLLYDDGLFGVPMRNSSYLNKTAKEILSKAKTDEEKLRMAYDFIKTFKWNGRESLYTSNSSIGFVIDDHSGNSADINIALVQLLDKLGFASSAVLLSTRENGFLSPIYPSLNKLNYVIAKVDLNGQQILIDGTEQYAPYDLLPERSLNLFGRIYDRENSEFIDLKTDKKTKELIYYGLNLDTDLQFTGKLSYQRFDYAALDFRNNYHSFAGREAYLEDMLKRYPGLRIQDAVIENLDSLYLPVKDNYDIVLKNRVDEVGENLYFQPLMLHCMEENPFKTDKRNYPVDFIHNFEKTFVVSITIPDGFEVSGLPETVNMKLPDNSAYFFYQLSAFANTIQCSFKYGINKSVFLEDEYQNIKEFFNQIIAKHAEPVILKRK